ncbi:hypothetical protein SARC_06633 [Sphaeroforma arctica JP610]|uniref:Uncharacterized protein n=1 Tax=Sphaeroforma arctica JP610 TaxID=667725 RepID=A0A0L0FWK2_9EUKA|nr:hypothetical protein SARC_06633 [Sphaeroforma arctica JP610]KNC81019.1 hypothetical protein SARC_06633 [Sphaeroforma arctica JP610]|eukprot:XP_014154921.1 hypothetical protein SARC_06633 [Sphaeroforma arctica JP610]
MTPATQQPGEPNFTLPVLHQPVAQHIPSTPTGVMQPGKLLTPTDVTKPGDGPLLTTQSPRVPSMTPATQQSGKPTSTLPTPQQPGEPSVPLIQ